MVRSEARTRKSEETKERLLDAAAKVFRDKGYAGARLADIAEAAGMHTPGVYYYFGSKEDLVEEVLRVGVARARRYVQDRVAALPEAASALDRLRAAIDAHVLMVLDIGDYTSANIRIFGQVPDDVRARHLADQRAYGKVWRTLLEDARAAGELRADVDLSVIRMLLLGALNWTAEWYRPSRSDAPAGTGVQPHRPGRQTATEVAREATAMICDGIGARKPAPAASARPST